LAKEGYTLTNLDAVENRAQVGRYKMFKKNLGSKQITISLRAFPAHSGPTGGHRHELIEEVLYVVGGNLSVKLDNEVVDLKTGDALRISPDVMRAYRNTSDKEVITIIASPILPGQRSDGIHDDDFWEN
jgi:quercetin dioxygenase-like cupin family protein